MNHIDYFNKSYDAISSQKLPIDFKYKNRKTATLEYVLENKLANQGNLWLEFGVHKGSSINLISNYTDKIYGFDSFETFPELNENESNYWLGLERFDLKGQLPKVNDNVELIKGYFDETLVDFLKQKNSKIAFAHVDCDIYTSTQFVLESLYEYLEEGTILVFDELVNYMGFENSEWKAWYEFITKYNIQFKWLPIKDKLMSWSDYQDIKSDYDIGIKNNYTEYKNKYGMKYFRNLGFEQELAIQITGL